MQIQDENNPWTKSLLWTRRVKETTKMEAKRKPVTSIWVTMAPQKSSIKKFYIWSPMPEYILTTTRMLQCIPIFMLECIISARVHSNFMHYCIICIKMFTDPSLSG